MRTASPLADTVAKMSSAASAVPALTVRSFGVTDPGKVRASNQDHFLVAELGRTLCVRQSSLPEPETQYGGSRAHILVVADGVGGSRGGEVASALAVESIDDFVRDHLRWSPDSGDDGEQAVLDDLSAAVRRANDRLLAEAGRHRELEGMGTTLTLVCISGATLFTAHAGDSRCYLYRAGKLRALTADHTLAGEMARRGLIRPDEVRTHHWRHVVTNILGGSEIRVQVDVRRTDLEPGDVVLLCTDGLTDMLEDAEIACVLAAEPSPEKACRRLVDDANERGGRDNITCIVARVQAA